MNAVSTPAMTAFERRAVVSLTSLYAFRMLGLFMVLPVLTLYGDQYRGSTPLLLGVALGAYGLSQALLQIPFGSLSDRFGRKPIIAFGLLIFALGSLVAASAETIYGLILGRTLQGAGAIAGAIMALVGDLTAERNRSKAMASIGMAIGVSFAVAIVLGPAISRWGGLSWVFVITAVLAVVGIGILFFCVPAAPVAPPKAPGGVGRVLRDWNLLRLNISVFVLHFSLMASFVVVPGLLLSELMLAKEQHWLVYIPVMVLSFLIMVPLIIWAEKKRQHRALMIIAVVMVFAAELIFLLSSYWSLGLLAGLLVFFVGFNTLEASLPSMLTRLAPLSAKGAASGVFSTFQFMGTFAGGACGGLLLTVGGSGLLFISCALLCMLLIWVLRGLVPTPLESTIYVDVHPSRITDASVQLYALAGVKEVLLLAEQSVASVRISDAEFVEQHLQLLELDAPLGANGIE